MADSHESGPLLVAPAPGSGGRQSDDEGKSPARGSSVELGVDGEQVTTHSPTDPARNMAPTTAVEYQTGDDGKEGARISRTESVLEHTPVTLSWENINIYVEDKQKKKKKGRGQSVDAEAGGSTSNSSSKKQIVKNVSGIIQPGTLMALMGASGAGKSTLMNVLTNRNLKSYKIEGEVKVNGLNVGSGIRNISAYVQQDDLFMKTLTVKETLTFRAMLRMDNRISKTARLQRVEEVIQEMGLTKCANTQIGGTGAKRGISGGEAKRLSVACEMLTNPPLMFLDEPTSGLDSFMAQTVITTLQSMAQKNRTILCTIHQPSSEIFALFDRLLLLAEGRIAYMGPSNQALDFLRNMNYVCPNNFNPADFYIMTLAIVPGQEEECRSKVNAICDAFKDTQENKENEENIGKVSSMGDVSAQLREEVLGDEGRFEASWGRQFTTILWRTWVSLFRDVVLFRVRVSQTLAVAVLFGLIYLRLDIDQTGVMDVNGALFLLITNASFVNMFSVLNSFPNEIPLFLREYGSGIYRTDTFALAKYLAELPTFVLLPFLAISIDYWMIGFYEGWQAFLICAAIIILVANVAVSFGLMISTATGDVNLALALAPPIIVPFMMFGGFFLNADSVPVYFIWMQYLSWFRYANELLEVNQWKDVTYIGCDRNQTIQPCAYNTGADVLEYFSFSEDNTGLNVGLLFVLLCSFLSLSFLFLHIRARRSKS